MTGMPRLLRLAIGSHHEPPAHLFSLTTRSTWRSPSSPPSSPPAHREARKSLLTGKFTNISATASSFEQAAQKLPQSWAPCHVPRLPSLMRSLFVNTRCDRHSLASRSAPRSAQLQMLAAPNLRGDSSIAAPSVCLQHRACVHTAADEHCRYHSPFFFSMGQMPFLIKSSQLALNTTGSTACSKIRHIRLLILEVWWVIFFKT